MIRRWTTLSATLMLLLSVMGPVSGQSGADAATARAASTRADTADLAEAAATLGHNSELSKSLLRETAGPGLYLIRLNDAPLATYEGGANGLAATSPLTTGARSLNAQSDASQRYVDYLRGQQDSSLSAMETAVGHSLDVVYRYVAGNNGFAVRLSPAEASEIAKMREVAFVQRDFERELHTDNGPAWIGAAGLWGTDCVDNCGEGRVVGVIDTGINPLNPSFADIGGDGYDHTNPNGAGVYVGVCDSADPSYDPTFPCNDKLIGAHGYATVNGGDPTDYDGHGSHTASTAAGNKLTAVTVTGNDTGAAGGPQSITRDIAGVAPHANVIAYAACCTGAALTAAIDDAILDGVDSINYSIGSDGASNLWEDFDTVGYLNARAAGIFVATSAGNNGPGADTVGSPADAPWLTAVGASTHDRALPNTLGSMVGGDTTPPADIEGKGFTVGYGPAPIVYAGDFPNANDPGGDPAQCLEPYPAGTWTGGEIVVCDRGTIARVDKGANVLAGGAEGFVLANDPGSGDEKIGDAHFLPGVHITFDDGVVLEAWLASGTGHMATISGATLDVDPLNGDTMAAFSSRGANRAIDTITPMVTAPGVDIIAADGIGGVVSHGFNSGTSMASPHVAGAGALMMNEHPGWSPAQIQSALMTTATTTLFKEDGVTAADPFDMGSGRLDLAAATSAGLVFGESIANYEAADPSLGGDPKTLNLASMANSQCLLECSFTRTVENVTGGSETWTASVSGLPVITVTPPAFTIADGVTQDIDIDVDVSALPSGTWTFGEVVLTPTGAGSDIKLPLAVTPSTGVFPEHVDVWTRRDAGSQLLEDLTAIEITDLTIETTGLTIGTQEVLSLSVDPTNGDPYDNLDDGTTHSVVVSVPAGATRLVAQTFDSEAPDVDLFVGTGSTPGAATEVCVSATGSAAEYCDIADPAAGDWWILVQNWEESGTPPDAITFDYAVVAGDAGNMTVTGPAAVPEATPYDLTVAWNEPALEAGDRAYGSFTLGSSAAAPGNIGQITVDVERHPNDVTKTVTPDSGDVGDTLTYEVTIESNVTHADQDYTITDTLPEGLTYVDGSATNGATHDGGVVTWSGTQVVPAPGYEVSTPATNPFCDTGFGGYVDLEDLASFLTDPGIVGDTVTFNAFGGQDGIDFFGTDYAGLDLADDGFAIFDAGTHYAGAPWLAQTLPNADPPNNVAAGFWQDFELFYDAPSNQGVTLATAGPGVSIVEYDNLELFGGSPPVLDMNIVVWGVVDPDFPEIIFAYDNIDQGLVDAFGPSTIGVENAAGDTATAFANFELLTGVLADGDQICFDLVPSGDPITFSYDVTVDEDAQGPTLTNEVTSIVTNDEASMEDTTSAGFTLDNSRPVGVADEYSLDKGATLFQNGVLDNDTDVDDNTLTARKTSNPSHGNIFFDADGTFVYVHDGSTSEADSFTYVANDGELDSAETTVMLVVNPIVVEPDNAHNLGLFNPASGEWHLRKGDGTTMSVTFGDPGDHPLVGDWDGDGVETPGVWRPPTDGGAGHFYGTNSVATGMAEMDFSFGQLGDIVLAGDWDGNGFDTVGLYRPAENKVMVWNTMGAVAPSKTYLFGDFGDMAFVGDFDANGVETIGLQRISTGEVFLKLSHTTGNADMKLIFGDPSDKMVAGDWTTDGVDTVALFRDSDATFYLRNTNTTGTADTSFLFGEAGWLPVAGEMGL
ncbi:MAG: S8 family serine peptidase [Acidimicrobiia bacterium]